MRPYLAIFNARFRALLQYRAAALAGLGTQVFWAMLQITVFTAFYASTSREQPMALQQVVAYIWLKQGLLLLLPWRPDPDIAKLVRSGDVVYEMLRPIDLYWHWYARSFAMRTAPAILRCTPMAVVAFALFDMQPPPSTGAAIAFAVSTIAAVMLSAAITTLLAVALLFTVDGRGIHALSNSVVNLFSGAMIPLPFFPDWLQPLATSLPFRGLMDTPFRLYLGDLALSAAPAHIGHQLVWTTLLIVAARVMLRRSTQRMAVQGG